MKRRTHPRTVFLACPYGQVGGGMGSIMAYLGSLGGDPAGRFRFVSLESRGGGRLIFSPLFLARAMGRIAAEAVSGRLAVVHLNLAERGSVYRKAVLLFTAKAVGAPVLLHLHAAQIIDFYQTMPPVGRALVRRMFRSADRVVVLGELWRRWVIDTLGVPPQAVTVVRNGVPATKAGRVPSAGGAPHRLLFLGNLLERKGISDLLHALALPRMATVNVRLTVAGGGNVEAYRALALRLGIARKVHFTGWVDQATARELLAGSDALVLPAYDEGLPLVILEAMASGVPVICTPVGAIPEVFEDGRTALFVTPGDRPGLARAVRRLANDPVLQASLAEAGLAMYRDNFTMEAFTDRVSALYAALDQPRPRSVPRSLPRPVPRSVRSRFTTPAEANDDR
jgi:glycosyltransferase involved in cell wall biosynthesis